MVKIFAVSDIHGHFSALKTALDSVGFDPENKDHLLICCGDCFDRGQENIKVFEYLSSLKHKILIRGNHEDMLEGIIERRYIDSTNIYNGTDITVSEFFGQENIDKYGHVNISAHRDLANALLDFIGSMYDYFETERYLFTHAWLPIVKGTEKMELCKDYAHAENDLWRESRYNEWYSALRYGFTLEDKTIVCGHRASYNACKIDDSRSSDDFSIYQTEKAVAIDSATVRSGIVNVFVTEDELPAFKTHTLSLSKEHLSLLSEGKKTVDMRLFDGKCKDISIGDQINFISNDSPVQEISMRVIGLYKYPGFKELIRDFSPQELGYNLISIENALSDMNKMYGKNNADNYGVLAIRLTRNT